MVETVPNTFPALFQAYTVVWGLLVVYIVSIGVRLRRIERRLAERSEAAVRTDDHRAP
jgi:CcmD family protein